MTFWEIIVLSVIQGIAEFLPISSSGHLVIVEHLFGFTNPETNLLLTILLHIASLIAICIAFYKDIINMLTSDLRILLMVIIGTIPAGLVGYLFSDKIEALFGEPMFVGIALMLTGIYLIIAEWRRKSAMTSVRATDAESKFQLLFSGGPNELGSLERASFWQVIRVGIAQAIAVVPGLSRSGLTIATGLLNGWERQAAAKFSFLLALPVMSGAAILKAKDFGKLTESNLPIPILLIGFIVCIGVSLLSIGVLMRMVRSGRLRVFAWYCLAAGLLVAIFVR